MDDEKRSLKERWNDWAPVRFCKENPALVIEAVCTVLSLIGTGAKIYADVTDYKDTIQIIDDDGVSCKVKCKRMHTATSLDQ